MSNEDFKKDIEKLRDDQDVQFKVKTLKLWSLASNQVHILDWLLLKSPNLIDLQIFYSHDKSNERLLEIQSELNIKKLRLTTNDDW